MLVADPEEKMAGLPTDVGGCTPGEMSIIKEGHIRDDRKMDVEQAEEAFNLRHWL